MKYLTINKCQHGTWAISLDDVDGNGTRLTEDKCCGRWTVVRRFQMSKELLLYLAKEVDLAINDFW